MLLNFVFLRKDYFFVLLNERVFFVGPLIDIFKLMNFFGFLQVKRLSWVKLKGGLSKKRINKELIK